MHALDFAIIDPRVKSTILMAMGMAHNPWAIGISEAQRAAFYADPNWNNGYYNRESPPAGGLAAARLIAMTTYRTPENNEHKYGRRLQKGKGQSPVEPSLNNP